MGVTDRQRFIVNGMEALHVYGALNDVEQNPSPAADVERLQRELDFLHRNPALHEQTAWASVRTCGTAACLAGWTTLHEIAANPNSEYTTVYADDDADRISDADALDPGRSDEAELVVVRRDNIPEIGECAYTDDRVSFAWVGSELLGLSDTHSGILFYSGNSLPEMYAFAALITDGAIVDPYEAVEVAA